MALIESAAVPSSPGQTSGGENWRAERTRKGDDLLGCLQFIAKFHDRPTSATALTAGLPLDDGRLPLSEFHRAAARIGLSAREVNDDLDELITYCLPALLFLHGGRPVVLTKADERGQLTIYLPWVGGTVRVDREKLAQWQSGAAIAVLPVFEQATDGAPSSSVAREHWFWGPVKANSKDLVSVAVAALIINLIGIASPLFTMNVYDRVLPNKAISTLWVLALGFATVLVFDFALKTARAAVIDGFGKKLDIKLSESIFEKALNVPLSMRTASTGEFVNRVSQYEFVREFLTSNTLTLFIDTLFIFISLLVIANLGGWISLIPMIAAVLVLAAGLLLQRMIGERLASTQAESSMRHAMLIESVSAVETIKAIRAEGHLLRKWDTIVRTGAMNQARVKFLSSLAVNLSLFLQQSVTVWIVIAGVYRFSAGEMSSGAIIACVLLSSRAVAPLTQLAVTLTRARYAYSAMHTLNMLMSSPDERVSSKSFVNRSVDRGQIEFRGASFNYPGLNRKVLDGINLKIEPGEKVGILGRVGSGKTTLGRLVATLYPLASGELLIDGVDVRQYHPHEVRKAVAIVSQETDLFIGSIRENLAIAKPDATDQELLAAARIAGVDEFVALHPAGYDLPVGERGRNLSTGQRQAVAIARAFLMQPKILFLDEPTSSMDLATERAFLTRVKETMRPDQTVIIATHRHSMLALVDRLIVIDNGRLVADGKKDDVLRSLTARGG